ncbi:MAG: uncharacterized membrane protein YbhN (UPF0104 family) [Algoriphagus sp.]|jgi:uncharacterized membrane protein YbhN (UPF0104 family)
MAISKSRYKLAFNLFLYLSLGFLAYFLYDQDYLSIPKKIDAFWMTFSMLILFVGFSLNAIQWVPLLKSQGIEISYFDSIRTFGMAVFGKYIPGKVWVHIGKSAQIAQAYNLKIAKVSEVSFFSQLMTLWVGSLAGLILLVYLEHYDLMFWSFLLFFVLIGLLISTKGVQNLGAILIKRILKKDFTFSSLRPRDVINVLPLYFLSILSYSLGFLFLIKALGIPDIHFFAMLAFPLAMTIGVVAIIVPGGLGVREVAIGTLLVQMAVSAEAANTISVASRLWFLCGEVFIFLLGLCLQRIWKLIQRKDLNKTT